MADIYLGSTDLSSATFKLGSSDVSALYMGSTQVWAPAAAGYGTPPSQDSNCVIFYDIGNASSYPGSGTTITDLKGNADGTLYGSGWTYDSGVSEGVLDQSGKGGSTRYVEIANPGFSGFTGTTFEMLWRNDQTLADDNVIARWVAGAGYSDTLWESNIQQYGGSPPNRIFNDAVSEQGTNASDIVYAWTPALNQWYHIVWTMEQGGYFKVYINNSNVGTSTNTFGASDTFLWDTIGAIYGSDNYTGGNWVGQWGSFRHYSVALSAAEVTANYNYYDAIVGF